jgi:hypothetical protein
MGQPAPGAVTADLAPGEQRFTLHGITWEQYETLRDATDHIPGLRMTYLEGVLELMSPSRDHEGIKRPDEQTEAVRAYRDALRG